MDNLKDLARLQAFWHSFWNQFDPTCCLFQSQITERNICFPFISASVVLIGQAAAKEWLVKRERSDWFNKMLETQACFSEQVYASRSYVTNKK